MWVIRVAESVTAIVAAIYIILNLVALVQRYRQSRKWLPLILMGMILSPDVHGQAQLWSGVLDASRATTDWTSAGVQGGIPTNRTQCGSTINSPGAGVDATSTIQTALTDCASSHPLSGAGGYVLLAAGTFRINTSLSIPSNVTLRGAGPRNTILDLHRTSGAAIVLGTESDQDVSANVVSITGGTSAGSTSITVSATTNMVVGNLIHINELNDAAFVDNNGCTWCDEWFSGGRVRRQISKITSVSGTTIGISPGLYYGYTHTPQASAYAPAAQLAGLELVQVFANNTGLDKNIRMGSCLNCWVKGIESNFSDADHVQCWYSLWNEIRDSYFHDSFLHQSGSSDSDIWIGESTTGTLVENNILTRMHLAVDLNAGPAGNVVGYNFSDKHYDFTAQNVLMFDMAMHGSHHQMNLWEGNVLDQIRVESYWGSGSWETLFRNYVTGTTEICLPYNARGTAGACHTATQGIEAIEVDFLSYQSNIVGNVATVTKPPGGNHIAYIVATETSRDTYVDGYDISYGYYDITDTNGSGTCTGSVRANCMPFATSLTHGNYTHADAATQYDYNIPSGHNPANPNDTLPASFYKSSKPSWWWNTIPWPAIGPDVTGGSGPGGHASLTASNPAQACYNAGPFDSSGFLLFDPEVCYTITPISTGSSNVQLIRVVIFMEWGACILGALWHFRKPIMAGVMCVAVGTSSVMATTATRTKALTYQTTVSTVQTVNVLLSALVKRKS
jgi:hypothetical protein